MCQQNVKICYFGTYKLICRGGEAGRKSKNGQYRGHVRIYSAGDGMKIKKYSVIIAAAAASAVLLLLGAPLGKGIGDGLALAAGIFIPATLPFYFLCSLASYASAGKAAAGSTALPLLLALTGGYPSGIAAAGRLCADGAIGSGQAKRICLLWVFPGPAFTVMAVGGRLLGSPQAGCLLLAAVLGGGLINSLTVKKSRAAALPSVESVGNRGFSEIFSLAMSDAALACLCAAAAIALSCGAAEAVIGLLTLVGVSGERISAIVYCLFEVTRASAALAALPGHLTLPLLAAVLAFGGLGVFAQLCFFSSKLCRPLPLLFSRLKHALFSFLLALALNSVFAPPLFPPDAMETAAALRRGQTPFALIMLAAAFALCLPDLLHDPKPLAFLRRGRYNIGERK